MVKKPSRRKLSDEQVMLILNMRHSLNYSFNRIMDELGVKISPGSISQIIYGLSYRDVYDKYWKEQRKDSFSAFQL